jgi:surface antigen
VAVSSSAGNTYYYGYCTWYAKQRRPDLPNRLGNGGQWVANAAAQGYATGSAPRAGAVAETTGHVAYVESVNGDGTIVISEMNGPAGWGVVGTRTVPASQYRYIY